MNEAQFIELLGKADTTGYLMTVAILCSGVNENGWNIVERFSREDFVRAIKGLRNAQTSHPQSAPHYEEAIAHIRREWLHRGGTV